METMSYMAVPGGSIHTTIEPHTGNIRVLMNGQYLARFDAKKQRWEFYLDIERDRRWRALGIAGKLK